jgi:hypothetical protein
MVSVERRVYGTEIFVCPHVGMPADNANAIQANNARVPRGTPGGQVQQAGADGFNNAWLAFNSQGGKGQC